MDSKDENKVVVVRKLHWDINANQIEEFKYLSSEVFEILLENNLTKWQIILYCDKSTLYLQFHKVESSTNDFTADLAVRIPGFCRVNKQYDGLLFDKNWVYLHSSFIRGYGTTLEIEISLMQKSDPINIEPESILSNFEKLLNAEKFSDFKFTCSDGNEIPAHRFVLAAQSPVMDKMLMSPMSESTSQTAVLEDISSETMMEVLRFLYTGKVENVEELTSDLLYCAEKYQLNELKNFVLQSMIKNISIDNALQYYTLADRYDAEVLLEPCVFFIKRNYSTLRKQEDWITFDAKMKYLLKFFSIDENKNVTHMLKTLKSYARGELPNECKSFP